MTRFYSALFIGFLTNLCFPLTIAADGTLLPNHRMVGYYGNFESRKLGVLGEYPEEEMLHMLDLEIRKWTAADPKTPVIPVIEYIAVVAHPTPGKEGKYITRMPDTEIQKAILLAKKINGLLILDIQPGLSDVQTEMAYLASYLALPNVMLALDPEFSMPSGITPGTTIGSLDAEDINYAINTLSEIVKKNNLPPKILIVHRFTPHMVTNPEKIKLLPEVQVVIVMDGWGTPTDKRKTYREVISPEPIQFTGIKLFYKEDLKKSESRLLTPDEILKLKPVPQYVLFQ